MAKYPYYITKEEAEETEELIEKFEAELAELLKKYVKGANEIGGEFRSPSIRSRMRKIYKSFSF